MSPYSDADYDYLDDHEPPEGLRGAFTFGDDDATHYLAVGRALRAQYLARTAGRLADSLRGWFSGAPARPERETVVSEEFIGIVTDRLKTPLTAIRASSEVLRDNPDMTPEQRKRFVDSVLEQNANLERLIGRMLANSRFEPTRRRWQINAASLARDFFADKRAHG